MTFFQCLEINEILPALSHHRLGMLPRCDFGLWLSEID
jgi:hypothetical protein